MSPAAVLLIADLLRGASFFLAGVSFTLIALVLIFRVKR